MTSTALAHRATVTELVHVYEKAAEDIRTAYGLIDAAEKRLNVAFVMDGSLGLYVRDRSNFRGRFSDPDETLGLLKRDTWRLLVDRLDIKRALSIKAAKQLDDQLERGELPDITVDSVLGFAEAYIENLPRLLEEAVKEVFSLLRPRGYGAKYKTNTQFEIGRRAILTGVISGSWSNKFQVNYYYTQDLLALEKVFRALDGKGEMAKSWKSELQQAIEELPLSGDGREETEYFKFRACRNGNLHLEFKRMDLVKRLNEVAGGKTFREASVD